jgi:hypothetical protein
MYTSLFILVLWFSGFILSRWMLHVEHSAESEQFTYGDQVTEVIISILSWATVVFILVRAWAASVSSYWKKPVEGLPKKGTKKQRAE